jgi:hypothetical protein
MKLTLDVLKSMTYITVVCEEINKSIPLPEKLKLIRTSPFANPATQVMLDRRGFCQIVPLNRKLLTG